MFVVTNRIAVSKGFEAEFEERFAKRRHLVNRSPGFVRNEVHRPRPKRFNQESGHFEDDPNAHGVYEVKTWWRSFEHFEAWTKSESFREAHKNRPPKEMFRGPNQLEVHEVFLTTEPELED